MTATAPAPRAAPSDLPETLIAVRSVTKTFAAPGSGRAPVLEDISLEVTSGEFVALLGRSGSGKSTLLRCIAGLIAPTEGEVLFRGRRLTGTNRGTAMVFQTFALLPWLTVQQNVELGLEARGVSPAERAQRAVRAIDTVGLDGYQTAFPKELSGGMRQRVGFARALVVEPDVLLMDEPFSALDVLTAENLRGELLELWEGQRFPTKAIVMVTHNIEEAVLLADRILVLGTNPGRIREEIHNRLARPRQRRTPDFDELVDHIYGLMTGREQPAAPPDGGPEPAAGRGTPGDTPLPHATVDGLSGLAEILLNRSGGGADLADLAEILGLEVDDLLPLVDALVMLGFATVEDDHLRLSQSGGVFAGANIQESKQIFARAALEHAPLVRTIDRALQGCEDHNLPSGFFADILHRSYDDEESERQLQVAINWGRYAELYAFDASRGQITREAHAHSDADGDDAAQPPPRGTLKVYLGAAPGSGKTFAMLREGRDRQGHGEDVVVAAVDTHGRPYTEEAIGTLEVVPPRRVTAEGRTVEEMDLDAALARRPQVALVDDLAHLDAPGSPHAHRWQDVDALRDAGIDVITTVDVADVESVRDLVEGVTGTHVQESLPDTVLDGADEIQFIDIAPEALRKRLRHGNILPRDRVDEALQTFFRPESLGALREIALRLVGQRMAAADAGLPDPQPVLVGVSGNPGSGGLIRRAARLARRTSAPCTVVVAALPGDESAPRGLDEVRAIAEQVGAHFVVREGNDPARVIERVARERGVDHVVVGGSAPAGSLGRLRSTIVDRLVEALPDVDIHVLAHPGPVARPQSVAAAGEEGTAAPAAPAPALAPDGRGTLRIYLGYARGVGTTTAMLDEARRRTSRGADVVIGAIATHGRPGVEAAVGALELLGGPDGPAAHDLLDVDALLARNPQVACIDDLRGPTVSGGTRAEAAARILDAGIALVTTLHLGDVRDDGVLALADDIELVDITPPALIERLRRGEIVPTDEVAAAAGGEYRQKELTAARELAFKTVADLIDRQLVGYLREHGIESPYEARPRVLAYLPPRTGMEPLLRRAAALAASIDGEFTATAVAGRPGWEERQDLMDAYARLAVQLGGQMVTLEGPSVAGALAEYARQHQVTEMVVARGARNRRWRGGTMRELVQLVPGIDVHLLSEAFGHR